MNASLSIEKKVFYGFCFVVFLIFCYKIILRIERYEYYHSIVSVSVTIPEGFDDAQIAETFSSKLVNFNESKFLLDTKDLQGYLFPDTYHFLSTDTEATVIKLMSDNFQKKIATILPDISKSGNSEKQIIIMASIIEKEANGKIGGQTEREFISGILWKRLAVGIPLEVDSAPETYTSKDLPTSPICNPGLAAIIAAVHPQSSPYLYYLHDKNGNIHYAKTFAEHEANIKKYLK